MQRTQGNFVPSIRYLSSGQITKAFGLACKGLIFKEAAAMICAHNFRVRKTFSIPIYPAVVGKVHTRTLQVN